MKFRAKEKKEVYIGGTGRVGFGGQGSLTSAHLLSQSFPVPPHKPSEGCCLGSGA